MNKRTNTANLGLGTAALGRPLYINIKQPLEANTQSLEAFKTQSLAVLEKAYSLGIRYFDTAPGYGLAERLLFDWLKTKNDPSIAIATKWGYTYVADFKENAKIHEVKEHSLKKLNEQWGVSKAFLPYLKVYQIHSTTLETGVLRNEAILNRLAYLKSEYQLKIGITTTGENQIATLKEALDVSVEGQQLFDSFQVTYNVLEQSLNSISKELIQQGKQLIIKEALANGRLFRNSNYVHYYKLYELLEGLALKYETTVDVVLLNFCAQTHPKSIILSGAANNTHLSTNVKMNTVQLSQEEIEKLATFRVDPSLYWHERKCLQWN